MDLNSRQENAIQRGGMIPSSFISVSGDIFRLRAETVDYMWSDLFRGILLKERETSEAYDVCRRLK